MYVSVMKLMRSCWITLSDSGSEESSDCLESGICNKFVASLLVFFLQCIVGSAIGSVV